MRDKVLEQLKSQFRPEFLNRVDSLGRLPLADRRGDPPDRRAAAGARARAAPRAGHRPRGHPGGQGPPHQDRLRRRLRRPPAAPGHPEPGRGPARRSAPGRPLPGRADDRRRPRRRRRADDRAARGEDARRGRASRGAAAEPLRLPGLRHEPSCAGKASAAAAAPGTRSSRRVVRDAPGRARRGRRGRRRGPAATAARAGGRGHRATRRRASTSSTACSAAGSCRARSSCSAASRASASRRSCSRRRPASPRPAGARVLYASGEESAGQLRLRAARLGPDRRAGRATPSTSWPRRDVERIVEAARALGAGAAHRRLGPDRDARRARRAGRLASARSASRPPAWRSSPGPRRSPVVLVGHVTKDGSLAGPKTLEHLVDAVLALEGDRYGACACCARRRTASARPRRSASSRWPARACVEVADPAVAFLGRPATSGRPPGSVVAATLEGSRPLLVEVQALVAPAGYGSPRRTASGPRPEPPGAARRGARPAGRASASAATTSTRTWPAA